MKEKLYETSTSEESNITNENETLPMEERELKIELTSQEDMINMAFYFLPAKEVLSMSDFERYCYTRDTLKEWNALPMEERKNKSLQLEVFGFEVKEPVWK